MPPRMTIPFFQALLIIAHSSRSMLLLNASTADITKTLNTLIVSQALQANNIIITVAKSTNPSKVSQNQSASGPFAQQNAWHVSCQDSFTTIPGVCDNWWYDGQAAYSLLNLGDINQNYYALMNQMFFEGWNTGKDLFWGAANCTFYQYRALTPAYNFPWHWHSINDAESNHTQDDNGVGWTGQISIDPSSLEISCGSNVRVCEWDRYHDPRVKGGKSSVRYRMISKCSRYCR